jgi:hypothetical protein
MVEYNIQTHHLFINFSTAYDSINRVQLFAAIKEFNFPDKLVGLVKVMMENSQCLFKLHLICLTPKNHEWVKIR